MNPAGRNSALLSIRNLSVSFSLWEAKIRALKSVDLDIEKGETLAVVGESGCGKSVTAKSILRIIPSPPGRVESGTIVFAGQDLLGASESEMRRIRGNSISMIFQEPMTSLNPAFTVGDQIAEVFRFHLRMSRRESWSSAVEQLGKVKIPSPELRAKQYPYQLSGGMRQRAMIAMALACRPEILIADEPTTALDVTIQAQILQLILELQRELELSVMLITHNLGIVASMAQRVAVMYAGQVVEQGDIESIFRHYRHPYVHGLLKSVPRLDQPTATLHEIPGVVPQMGELSDGCAFANRCIYVMERCRKGEPEVNFVSDKHWYRCGLKDRPW
jgi:oligopeptide/dipeptide ABC transporter ATP-binding protein